MWSYFRDFSLLLILCTTCTYCCVVSSKFLYIFVSSFVVLQYIKHIKNSSIISVQKGWLNWFEIAKLLGGAFGLVVIQCEREFVISKEYTVVLIPLILVLNMLEAVVQDVLFGIFHFPNSIVGLCLMGLIPWELSTRAERVSDLHEFPLSTLWIISYSLWNANFSYGFNYSISTRIVLLSPLIISFFVFKKIQTWLASRCISMMLNMLFRASSFTYLYDPNRSQVTTVNTFRSHNESLIFLVGFLNFILILFLVNQSCVDKTSFIPICKLLF